ncbi:MAG: hypothetical protein ACJ76I_16390 [Gaiellaceae bacterium]
MSSSSGAKFSGALAVLIVPAAVAASRYVSGVSLLQSLYVAVPASFVLALIALAAARRARFRRARSVFAAGRSRWDTILAWAGLYVAITGALALAVYGALRAAQ